ncbi:anaphase-promoting complex subunit 1 [Teleopsis dalmanni]|uniref:anaphase-promoting complex subunit 1 n=1 Tax=Teleopsis dalmanni TaxID=139649 RepID=UPI0018CE00F2|nr:anaphase-promoting complex subunit 1 [Teleopsis dalmanni]
MNVALNSVVASAPSSTRTVTTTTKTTKPGDLQNQNAISSNNGLALLAAITLKNALNINSNNSTNSKAVLLRQEQHVSSGFANKQTSIYSFSATGITCENIENISSSSDGLLATKASIFHVSSSSEATSSNITNNKYDTNREVSPIVVDAAVISTTPPATPSSVTTTNFNSSLTTNSNSTTVTPITKSNLKTPTTNNTNGNTNNNNNSNNKHFKIPSDILDDLSSRFIINVPDMELNDLIRICFQIELAHWFYLDFFCTSDDNRKLQSCGIKTFAMQLFQHIPFLNTHLSSIDKVLEDWKNYKLSVPTYGAILISEDLNYCLLVQSYFAKSSWGFPKGKVNENEDPVHCATREVYEETGYDITNIIVPSDFIDAVINFQYTRLYIVQNVPLKTKFSPRTRNEIKCCDWFPIDALPNNKNDAISKAKLGKNSNAFFMIIPFVKRLKKWVNEKRALSTETNCQLLNTFSTTNSIPQQTGKISPKSTSPVNILHTKTTANNASINNQRLQNSSNNSSNKKNKLQQQNNIIDDKNALRNCDIVAMCNTASKVTLSTSVPTTSSTRQSGRQRHKSMGDLDGVRVTNLSNYNQNPSNSAKLRANPNSDLNSHANGSNQKRNMGKNGNTFNGSFNVSHGNGSSKRQLFHSQSQTGNGNIAHQNEKIVSSFDLIRKEKQQQQLKNSAQNENTAKAQRQTAEKVNKTNVSGGNGRVRAKSQGDKMNLTPQQYREPKNNANNNDIVSNNTSYNINPYQKSRMQRQNSMSATNSSGINNNINTNTTTIHNKIHTATIIGSNSHNINNMNNSDPNVKTNGLNTNKNNNNNNNDSIIKANSHITPPTIPGTDLVALASSVSNSTMTASQPKQQQKTEVNIQNNFEAVTKPLKTNVQKPRPSSVSLQYDKMPTSDGMHQLQRMASGTGLRILKRANSYQPSQLQRQHSPFNPSLNSWTNFSFTKNFISNVFC